MATAITRSVQPPLSGKWLPVFLGLGSACFIAFVLLNLGVLWASLLLAGIALVAAGFRANDLGRYWTIIFLLTIPLRMEKMLFAEPEAIRAFTDLYG
ncbi:MAG: hypothetical protein ACRD1Z_05470, partial [Vicinamibacteria bacterium]